ncbi:MULTISPECIES: CidA/LrgA family protein [unclassified Rhizobium]|jgi:holin-like protein|uniref:CidA/LrgA family protein n=1 Tax=unclassified Rhizobium TaxID=2613769 RepID=UPI0006488787|nr:MULTISPECIES: CidA/LrgA family protein [unclassified Rhizobium]MBN8953195.1 CidA/LrgA family protein [Rhizobium tropici]OJY75686.1 MAG: CidA/LrgA family protein [Rhizobium sp. 60-20]RKD75100.1 holin-like protein [Rhizobium sp. WW_1]
MRVDLQNHSKLCRLAQILLLLGFWQAGEAIVRLTHLPIPGAIAGMLLVLALFASGRVSLTSMKRGAEWFLAEMLLFFVPAVLALLDHGEFIGIVGLKILAVIFAGTVIVMGVTAIAIDIGFRLMMRQGASSHAHS